MAEKKKTKLTREYLNVNLRKSDLEFIEKLAGAHPWTKRREKPVEAFLTNLMKWLQFHNELPKNPEMFNRWSRRYKFYRKKREGGLYPLPQAVTLRWNKYCKSIIIWLVEIGFLKCEEKVYIPSVNGRGICRYYYVYGNINVKKNNVKKNDSKKVILDLKKLGIKHNEVCLKINKSRTTLYRWYVGYSSPKSKDLSKIKDLIQAYK